MGSQAGFVCSTIFGINSYIFKIDEDRAWHIMRLMNLKLGKSDVVVWSRNERIT